MMIDCDGHILEPPDRWEKYLEPRYRDRAIRIRVGDDGYEYLEYLDELRHMTAPMTESGRRAILGENVARVYRLA